jgi:hypothetical protein
VQPTRNGSLLVTVALISGCALSPSLYEEAEKGASNAVRDRAEENSESFQRLLRNYQNDQLEEVRRQVPLQVMDAYGPHRIHQPEGLLDLRVDGNHLEIQTFYTRSQSGGGGLFSVQATVVGCVSMYGQPGPQATVSTTYIRCPKWVTAIRGATKELDKRDWETPVH